MIFHSKRDKNTEKQALFPPNPSANRATPPLFPFFAGGFMLILLRSITFLGRILSEKKKA
ncbi:hypothetical protein CS388_05795 [Porphyromonas gingivalis]|nr:hypothetical protein CS545_00635 [Porphyromonas gingivalis]ATS08574.1 hypothetical protein CS388_05795 [Porphyromonas gingivalis]